MTDLRSTIRRVSLDPMSRQYFCDCFSSVVAGHRHFINDKNPELTELSRRTADVMRESGFHASPDHAIGGLQAYALPGRVTPLWVARLVREQKSRI